MYVNYATTQSTPQQLTKLHFVATLYNTLAH